MAGQKLNVKKLIGAFNKYLDSESTQSFSDFVKSTKVGIFDRNTHINIMKFNQTKDKYEEFLNYLLENYDKYNGNKHKAIAIRQIRDECLDNIRIKDECLDNRKITITSDSQVLHTILAKRPVSTDKWHKTKYIVRKTGKTLLMTTLLSTAIGAGLGLVAAWGVGLIPGMTGNIASNFLNAVTNGAVFGAIIGPTYYISSYLINKAKIKRLGKKDKENFNTLNKINLKTTEDLESLNIPLMTLVHDFIEYRQISKELRTTKNPFKIMRHRKYRDLNYIRFEEISESFGQLIDSLVKSGNHQNALIVKEYYFDKFKSLFSHPDFARIADKYSIDKKLSSQNLVSRTISNRELKNNINLRDSHAVDMAFNFVSKPIASSKVEVTPSPKAPAKKVEAKIAKSAEKKAEETKLTTKTSPKKPTVKAPAKKVETKAEVKKAETKKAPIKEESKTNTSKSGKPSKKEQNIEALYHTTLFDLIEENKSKTSIAESKKKTEPTKAENTIITPKKKTSIAKNPNSVFDRISKEAVLVVENEVLDLLKDENSNLRKEMGISKKAVEAFIKLSDLHFGQNPITGKDSERSSIAKVMSKKNYQEKFKDLSEKEYERIMSFALGNVNIIDEP